MLVNWYLLTFISTQIWSREMVYVLRLNGRKCREGQVYGWQMHGRVSPARMWAILAEQDVRSSPCYVSLRQPGEEGACRPSRFGTAASDLEGSMLASLIFHASGDGEDPDSPVQLWLLSGRLLVCASSWLAGQLLARHQEKQTVCDWTVGTQSWPVLKCMRLDCKQWLPPSHDFTPHMPPRAPFQKMVLCLSLACCVSSCSGKEKEPQITTI